MGSNFLGVFQRFVSKMSSRYQQSTNNFDRVNFNFGNGVTLTVAELFLLISLGLSIIILMFLCFLEFHRRAQKTLDGKRKKKRVLKYLAEAEKEDNRGKKKEEVKDTVEKDVMEKVMEKV